MPRPVQISSSPCGSCTSMMKRSVQRGSSRKTRSCVSKVWWVSRSSSSVSIGTAFLSGLRPVPLRFGIILPHFATTWPELLAIARRAEAAGYDDVWASDHLLGVPGAGTLELAARKADLWNAPADRLDELPELVARFEEQRRATGRDVEIVARVGVLLGTDAEERLARRTNPWTRVGLGPLGLV